METGNIVPVGNTGTQQKRGDVLIITELTSLSGVADLVENEWDLQFSQGFPIGRYPINKTFEVNLRVLLPQNLFV